MKRYMPLTLLLLLLLVMPLGAQTQKQADSTFSKKDYTGAAHLYETLLKKDKTADNCYNLGNCYYKLKDYPKAVLSYERALKLDPGHEDARFNLDICKTRLVDHFNEPSGMFFIIWWRQLIASQSVQTWTAWSFFALLAAFAFCAVFLLSDRLWLRKAGFGCALFAGLVFILLCVFAGKQRNKFYNEQKAVVTSHEVQLYMSPATSAKKVRMIHEGTTVTLTDSYGKDWLQVQLPDGTSAWLTSKHVTKI